MPQSTPQLTCIGCPLGSGGRGVVLSGARTKCVSKEHRPCLKEQGLELLLSSFKPETIAVDRSHHCVTLLTGLHILEVKIDIETYQLLSQN